MPAGGGVQAEENLWLLVREFRGPLADEGEQVHLRIIPSAWSRRKAHTKVRVTGATLKKGTVEAIATALGEFQARPFTWSYREKETVVWVEAAHPRRIVR